MAILQAIRAHIEGVAKKAGPTARYNWSPDCSSEMQAEDEALERRLRELEYRISSQQSVAEALTRLIDQLEERLDASVEATATIIAEIEAKVDQPDWRQRR